MAYDPTTGKWIDEDLGVATRLTGLLEADSDYLKGAGTVARQASNRRGLLNSTMNTEAVEAARIKAALPIASQEASQANERQMLGRQLQTADIQQQRGIASTEGMQTQNIEAQRERLELDIGSRAALQATDISSREGMQFADIAARAGLQAEQLQQLTAAQLMDIASREGMQLTELRSILDRQQIDILNRESMQLAEIEARFGLQAGQLAQMTEAQLRDIASREGMLDTELQSMLDRQQVQIESNEFMQSLDLETRQLMQGLDLAAQERIINLNIASTERISGAAAAVAIEVNYTNLLAAIMSNPDIPAADRQRYMDHAARIRDSGLALVEQMYNIDLEWEVAPQPGFFPQGLDFQ